MAREYSVTIPMAGHLIVSVIAENEEEAIEKAFAEATIDNLEDWETMETFTMGNVCYCPRPWDVEATDEGEVE